MEDLELQRQRVAQLDGAIAELSVNTGSSDGALIGAPGEALSRKSYTVSGPNGSRGQSRIIRPPDPRRNVWEYSQTAIHDPAKDLNSQSMTKQTDQANQTRLTNKRI